MPYQLTYPAPKKLNDLFRPYVIEGYGVVFKNAVPLVKNNREYFEKITLREYEGRIGKALKVKLSTQIYRANR